MDYTYVASNCYIYISVGGSDVIYIVQSNDVLLWQQ